MNETEYGYYFDVEDDFEEGRTIIALDKGDAILHLTREDLLSMINLLEDV